MTTTEDETNGLPFTVRRKPCCTSANVIVLGERDPMIGAGGALPHKRLSALQPWKTSKASRSALRGRQKALIRFIYYRTLGCLVSSRSGAPSHPTSSPVVSPSPDWLCLPRTPSGSFAPIHESSNSVRARSYP